MDFSTTCYTQETPGFLWTAFTNGPADRYERYNERITQLIAADVLTQCPDELTDDQRRIVEALASEVEFADV